MIKIPKKVQLCAVTKGRSIKEVEDLLKKMPSIKIIAENRWPDCQEKFEHFKNLEKHFIGRIQTNKIRKILPLVDLVQSVHSIKLLQKIDRIASELNKTTKFYFQVNISEDPQKQGIAKEYISEIISLYKKLELKNVKLDGLMTIGSKGDQSSVERYYVAFKRLFDQINKKHFPNNPLKTLSMGMSQDYKIAIECGSTMVRVGSRLFQQESCNEAVNIV